MSVALGVQTESVSIFGPLLCDLAAGEILTYYKSRNSVKYFPIADAGEVRRDKIDAILENRFEFNGDTHSLKPAGFWTENPTRDLEWLIHLHKFYYAVGLGMAQVDTGDDRYAVKWVELTSSWIDSTPVDFLPGDVAGRRIRNWIYAHYYFVTLSHPPAVTPEFYNRFLFSLWQQVNYLIEHLSPARNHRTLELCAVFWAAVVFPEFRGAAEWLEFSRRELTTNVLTDLLDDGVQCELSPDYHHIVLRNCLAARRLSAMNDIPMPAIMDELLRKALKFSMYAHTPAGEVPAFSDGDRGNFLYLLQEGYELYGDKEFLFVSMQGRQGKPPSHRSVCFRDSGYIALRSGWGEQRRYEDEHHLLFDCGPLGAGNHGHFDLLSFELTAHGRSLVVDPGRYTYDESGEVNERALFRGTAAHNTVLVDGRNQTRYQRHGRKFRVQGPAPDHELKAFVTTESFDFVHAVARSHEYPVVHERGIFFLRGEYWVIYDRLRANEEHQYDLLFHLAPEACQAVLLRQDATGVRIDSPGLVLAQPADARITPAIEDGYVSPEYGRKYLAPVIRFALHAAEATLVTVLYPFADVTPSFCIEGRPNGIRVTMRGQLDEIVFPDGGGVHFERNDAGRTTLRCEV